MHYFVLWCHTMARRSWWWHRNEHGVQRLLALAAVAADVMINGGLLSKWDNGFKPVSVFKKLTGFRTPMRTSFSSERIRLQNRLNIILKFSYINSLNLLSHFLNCFLAVMPRQFKVRYPHRWLAYRMNRSILGIFSACTRLPGVRKASRFRPLRRQLQRVLQNC